MEKDFLKSGIIIPAIIALVLGIIGVLFINGNVDNISPFTNGEEILYYENLEADNKVEAKKPEELTKGDMVGQISSGTTLNLRYMADYVSLPSEASLSDKGVFPGEVGTAYIQITNNNKGAFSSSFTLSGIFSGKYKKVDEKSVNTEDAVYLVTPRAKSSVVVFYQERGSYYGLSSKYRVMVYEEGN